jgi:hypothetical protein
VLGARRMPAPMTSGMGPETATGPEVPGP